MLSGGRRTADVVATSPMRLITLSKWDLRRISGEIGEQLEALVEQRQRVEEERAGFVLGGGLGAGDRALGGEQAARCKRVRVDHLHHERRPGGRIADDAAARVPT